MRPLVFTRKQNQDVKDTLAINVPTETLQEDQTKKALNAHQIIQSIIKNRR